MEDLKYPIGKYIPQPFSAELRRAWLSDIEALPKALEYAIINLDAVQLEEPYRPGGWNSLQVVHHVADSHMNAYIRFKLGLTEVHPAIKPYDEAKWAEMNDVKHIPINVSCTLLFALHTRWLSVLQNINEEEWNLTVYHTEYKKDMSLWYLLGMYAWHGKHHTAHINQLRKRNGW